MHWPFSRKQSVEQSPTAPALLPLTPEYREEQHGIYFAAIEDALTGPNKALVKNIALTGSYGVGKSSILQKVASAHQKTVVFISLSTLGFVDEQQPEGGVAKVASTKTNRIQKEIVKQLLYSQDPVKMPGSRYRRVTRFRFWREAGLAALLAVPITLVFFISGWSVQLAELARLPDGFEDLINVPVWLLGTFFVMGVRKVLHNRIHIEKVSTGDATIALSAESPTFFDEYLDEIVYFFERTKAEIVVFEDIDRFDDAHIFETLRSLNTLLNGAKQLGDRNIRFVYAIKDSIFDELGVRAAAEESQDDDTSDKKPDAAETEVARANRTKFFDLVIPVVPFVTHRSARDLLKSTLSGIKHNVSDDLIDLVARHVADMRLIKNIRNEFAIFRQRIITEGSLDLNDDALLAMILYKSTHMSDFELIKTGKSKLDLLYADSRAMVNAAIADRSATIRKARLERAKLQPAALRSKSLGDSLFAYLQRVFRHAESSPVTFTMTMAGESLTEDQLRTADFWEKFAAETAPLEAGYRAASPWGQHSKQMTFTRKDVALALDDPINPKDWVASRRAVLDKQIAEATADQAFLQHADMSDLSSRAEFTQDDLTFAEIIDARLDSELARQLVKSGYIDRNYTLYTSTFYAERVSAEATNFILKNIDPNRVDIHFELTADDVEAVIRERGRSVLEQRAAYNLSILDYLLEKDAAGAETLLGRLSAYGEDEQALLLAYLESGNQPKRFVTMLTQQWSKVFTFLAGAAIDDAHRIELFDQALAAISAEMDYEVDEHLRELLENHYLELKTLSSDQTSIETGASAATLLRNAGATVSDLRPLSEKVRNALVEVGAYSVSRKNLDAALEGSKSGRALDEIRTASPAVYQRLLADLPSYLESLRDKEVTLTGQTDFAAVINDILSADASQVGPVVERSADDAFLVDLSEVNISVWGTLAAAHKFPASFENVAVYIEEIGMDGSLAIVLVADGAIEADDDTADDEKLALALKILAAKEHIPSQVARSNLVESLNLDSHIAATSVPLEEGNLVGQLIGDGVIADDAASFALIGANDWAGREHAITQSAEFSTFMTTAELPVQDLGRLFASTKISDAVKKAVLARVDEFAVGASAGVLSQVADYALASGQGLLVPSITQYAVSIGANRTLQLLQPLLDSVTMAELAPILEALGGEYRKLAGPTGKRPRFTKSNPLLALVQRLTALGVVGSLDEDDATVRVNMRRP